MKYENIEIVGSEKFKEQTVKALNLIKKKSKRDFNKINNYLKKIRFAKQTGMIFEKAQFDVGNKNAFNLVEWYSSAIVHDTHHFYLHAIKGFLWKKGNFTKHEKLCVGEQVRFLKKIKASKELVKYCKNALKTKYWYVKNRNW